MPSFLGMRFSVAVGMHGATDDEWFDYHKMFARSVRHIMFNLVKGYDGTYRGIQGVCSGHTMGMGRQWVCHSVCAGRQVTIGCLLEVLDISCLTS